MYCEDRGCEFISSSTGQTYFRISVKLADVTCLKQISTVCTSGIHWSGRRDWDTKVADTYIW